MDDWLMLVPPGAMLLSAVALLLARPAIERSERRAQQRADERAKRAWKAQAERNLREWGEEDPDWPFTDPEQVYLAQCASEMAQKIRAAKKLREKAERIAERRSTVLQLPGWTPRRRNGRPLTFRLSGDGARRGAT